MSDTIQPVALDCGHSGITAASPSNARGRCCWLHQYQLSVSLTDLFTKPNLCAQPTKSHTTSVVGLRSCYVSTSRKGCAKGKPDWRRRVASRRQIFFQATGTAITVRIIAPPIYCLVKMWMTSCMHYQVSFKLGLLSLELTVVDVTGNFPGCLLDWVGSWKLL